MGFFSNERTKKTRFGEVYFTKSRSVRKVSIALKPFEGICVTLPFSVSFAEAERIVETKYDWIEQNLEKIKSIENRFTIFTEETEFRTYAHGVRIVKGSQGHSNISMKIASKELVVTYPADFDVRDDKVQEAVRYGITQLLRREAERYLPEKVEDLALQHGFRYNKLSFRDTKTRWGSCSHDDKISLNIQLMRLPERLIDYVILHELCHTVEKNHGPHFWDLLQSLTSNARGKARELQNYSTKIW